MDIAGRRLFFNKKKLQFFYHFSWSFILSMLYLVCLLCWLDFSSTHVLFSLLVQMRTGATPYLGKDTGVRPRHVKCRILGNS